MPTRWIDQGATQALPILRVATRQQSGFVEDLLRSQVADKTNWRALLKGDAEVLDLPFSTYRRHLARAHERLVEVLWSVEVGRAVLPVGEQEMGTDRPGG